MAAGQNGFIMESVVLHVEMMAHNLEDEGAIILFHLLEGCFVLEIHTIKQDYANEGTRHVRVSILS